MEAKLNLRRLAKSPSEFRAALRIGKRPFVPDDWQQQDLQHTDAAMVQMVHGGDAPVCRRHWWERGRGHSKSYDCALLVVWALLSSRRPLSCVWASVDMDAAKLGRLHVRHILNDNPWLGEFVQLREQGVVNKITGSELSMIARDVPSSFGAVPDLQILDELSNWKKSGLFHAMLSAAAKKPDSVMIVASNAGELQSWQHKLRDQILQDPAWRLSALGEPCASWLRAEDIDEQRRLLPDHQFRRLWLNQWAETVRLGVDPADVDACLKLTRPPPPTSKGYSRTCGVDLGVRRDGAAVVVVGRHDGWQEIETVERHRLSSVQRAMCDVGWWDPPPDEIKTRWHDARGDVRLECCQVWRPEGREIDLELVEQHIGQLAHTYPGLAVYADPWQFLHMAQRLRKRGVEVHPVRQQGHVLNTMNEILKSHLQQHTVELWPCKDLIDDLLQLRVCEKTGRLVSPKVRSGGHGDAARAFSLALFGLHRTPTSTWHESPADDTILAWS